MVARAVVGLVMKKPKKLMKKPKTMNSNKYLPNTKQSGEALELLSYLEDGSVSLVFLDPQYEVVNKVLHLDYPLYAQSDYQVLRIMEQVSRVLKPSGFALLWVNKTLLGNDRVPLWLMRTRQLKIVDFLVWDKLNGTGLGVGSWLRSQAEFGFLIQKAPTKCKLFKNRSFGNVWKEKSLPSKQRNHPHQKPKGLIRALIEATTEKGDLIVDPCAGSFVVLEVCKETEREFMGVDLTYNELKNFNQERAKLPRQIREND
jgi:site-specific DNA-methyltransferase (adenine-specific)